MGNVRGFARVQLKLAVTRALSVVWICLQSVGGSAWEVNQMRTKNLSNGATHLTACHNLNLHTNQNGITGLSIQKRPGLVDDNFAETDAPKAVSQRANPGQPSGIWVGAWRGGRWVKV